MELNEEKSALTLSFDNEELVSEFQYYFKFPKFLFSRWCIVLFFWDYFGVYYNLQKNDICLLFEWNEE